MRFPIPKALAKLRASLGTAGPTGSGRRVLRRFEDQKKVRGDLGTCAETLPLSVEGGGGAAEGLRFSSCLSSCMGWGRKWS